MATTTGDHRLFEAIGVRITFALVQRLSLEFAQTPNEVPDALQQDGNAAITWSPGAGPHLWEVYNQQMARRVSPLQRRMNTEVRHQATAIERAGLRLLPGGGHPWMAMPPGSTTSPAPLAERIFALRSYAHAIGQPLRISVSFRGDGEFTKLFAAVRLLLPIIPAIAAASPFVNGAANGMLNNRLHAWHTADRPTGLIGPLIPEAAFTEEDYYRTINAPLAQALAEVDALDLLGHDLANTRGAVATFDPGHVSIRMADTQESVVASLAVAEMIVAVLRALVKGRWVSTYLQRAWHEQDLQHVLEPVIRDADEAVITDRNYPVMFGLMDQEGITAGKLWQHLFVELYSDLSEATRSHMAHILEHGCLARRILRRTGPTPDLGQLRSAYDDLAGHLTGTAPFR